MLKSIFIGIVAMPLKLFFLSLFQSFPFGFFIVAYLVGSIPFGLIVTKIFLKKDIRDIGSGNIGATNVLRTGNKVLAALTLFLDGAKGAILILLINNMLSNSAIASCIPNSDNCGNTDLSIEQFLFVAGLFAILGHCFPIWLKFKGGKGVATALGVLLTAVPYSGLAACTTWLITAKISKISSLSALTALAIAPVITLLFYDATSAIICTLITALVFYRHKDNIKRLREGTEPKIGGKKNAARTP